MRRDGSDVGRVMADGRTAIFFGFLNPSPSEDDLGLTEICPSLGAVLRALTGAGGMLGFSLYPHHLKAGPDCTLEEFAR